MFKETHLILMLLPPNSSHVFPPLFVWQDNRGPHEKAKLIIYLIVPN